MDATRLCTSGKVCRRSEFFFLMNIYVHLFIDMLLILLDDDIDYDDGNGYTTPSQTR